MIRRMGIVGGLLGCQIERALVAFVWIYRSYGSAVFVSVCVSGFVVFRVNR